MQKHILIVGGTSGLGLELATQYATLGHIVTVTGRKDPQQSGIQFLPFEIDEHTNVLAEKIDALLPQVLNVDTFVYAAGYYQEGTLDILTDSETLRMFNVGIIAPTLLIQRLKKNKETPLAVILVTSSSQVTPREKEPVYTAVKAALGMLGNSLGLDIGLGTVLVVAPSGMKTAFWDSAKDITGFLDPKWVAERIIALSSDTFKYRFAKILREPDRVEIVETRT